MSKPPPAPRADSETDSVLTPAQVADLLQIRVELLYRWLYEGTGPVVPRRVV